MSTIKPFKAVHYNTQKISDMTDVVSPPYDVINAEQQAELHDRSPYNFAHIDLGKDKKSDDDKQNKYTRAKSTFEDWLSKEIMVQDEAPGIYFYQQEYKVLGQQYSRLGFIGLMSLGDEEESKIFPHENTHQKAKDDRLQLTQSLNSYLSSIFVCFSDRQRKIEKIFATHLADKQPLVDIEFGDQIRHKLWCLDDPRLIEEINGTIEGQQLFIADGHHRFEVAKQYRQIQKGQGKNNGNPYNYVMTYFTNLDSHGLQIFPIHRVVKRLPESLDFLEEYFRIDKLKNKDDLLVPLGRAGKNEHAFGLYTRDGVRLLRLKSKLLINEHVKTGSDEYKKLDAAILKSIVFDRIGLQSDDVVYANSYQDAINMVDEHQAEAAFIMNPVKISQLKSVALNGERMPPKTTFFYPKVLSGLTVYKMD